MGKSGKKSGKGGKKGTTVPEEVASEVKTGKEIDKKGKQRVGIIDDVKELLQKKTDPSTVGPSGKKSGKKSGKGGKKGTTVPEEVASEVKKGKETDKKEKHRVGIIDDMKELLQKKTDPPTVGPSGKKAGKGGKKGTTVPEEVASEVKKGK